jgi:hypothetical protein
MPRKHNPKKIEKARNLYVLENRTSNEIAVLIGVSKRTVLLWKEAARKQGDDWDVHRTAKVAASMDLDTQLAVSMEKFSLLQQLVEKQLLEEANNGTINSVDATTSLAKLARAHRDMTSSILNSSKKISELSVAMRVLQEIKRVTQESFPQHIASLADVYEQVGKHLSQVFKP